MLFITLSFARLRLFSAFCSYHLFLPLLKFCLPLSSLSFTGFFPALWACLIWSFAAPCKLPPPGQLWLWGFIHSTVHKFAVIARTPVRAVTSLESWRQVPACMRGPPWLSQYLSLHDLLARSCYFIELVLKNGDWGNVSPELESWREIANISRICCRSVLVIFAPPSATADVAFHTTLYFGSCRPIWVKCVEMYIYFISVVYNYCLFGFAWCCSLLYFDENQLWVDVLSHRRANISFAACIIIHCVHWYIFLRAADIDELELRCMVRGMFDAVRPRYALCHFVVIVSLFTWWPTNQ